VGVLVNQTPLNDHEYLEALSSSRCVYVAGTKGLSFSALDSKTIQNSSLTIGVLYYSVQKETHLFK
jgi:hypothetical protein